MYDDALTQDDRDKAHSSVRVDVPHVVIGVGIVHRHHARITYQYEILTFVLVVRLYVVIVTSFL